MNIITQLVILTLSLLLVNADLYCTNLYKDFKHKCTPSLITIRSCCDLKTFSPPPGIFKMSTRTFGTADVYCDTATDGGGWIVIQRNRKDSKVNFNKNWIDYEKGFGNLTTDFWYGLEAIHCFTQTGQWEMRVDYQKNDKTWSYLHYNQFSVGSASEEYPLTVGQFTGEGTDRFVSSPLNGMKFSTPDNDNDKSSSNCAEKAKDGFWYNRCSHINPNRQPPWVAGDILSIAMKIRPKDCITH
ncbi:ficolin-1-like [Dysidea avara]|uniref:ficolin-1-like n=1 Tax=Dysidea avara TaxID=196820 RepID=UPI00332E974C